MGEGTKQGVDRRCGRSVDRDSREGLPGVATADIGDARTEGHPGWTADTAGGVIAEGQRRVTAEDRRREARAIGGLLLETLGAAEADFRGLRPHAPPMVPEVTRRSHMARATDKPSAEQWSTDPVLVFREHLGLAMGTDRLQRVPHPAPTETGIQILAAFVERDGESEPVYELWDGESVHRVSPGSGDCGCEGGESAGNCTHAATAAAVAAIESSGPCDECGDWEIQTWELADPDRPCQVGGIQELCGMCGAERAVR